MYVWRLVKQKHQEIAFFGKGGLYASGRWHPKGYRIVDTAESMALASLEVFVHLESERVPWVAIRAKIPDNLAMKTINQQDLPENWQDISAYPVLQQIGKQWLQSQSTPILKVPSAIVPVEFNYLLNLRHPDLTINLEPAIVFKFDRRMWKSS